MESQVQELERKKLYLEAENKQLYQEVEQNKAQLQQYKTVCESQQKAMKDKDELLEQFRVLTESLQNDIKGMKELKSKSQAPTVSSGYPSFSHPWSGESSDEQEPEQYRKLFIGGLNYDTDEDSLREHFEKFGEVVSSVVMKDQKKQSRGFGFIIYKSAAMVDAAQEARPHLVDSRTVDSKRALPKEDTEKRENSMRTKKVFVGGMRRDTEESDLYEYFGRFGQVDNVEMMTYKDTGKKRGFAFVFFGDYDPVDKLILIKHHMIGGNRCEVKRAVPREDWSSRKNYRDYGQNQGGSSGSGGGGGGGGGGNGGGGNGGNYQDMSGSGGDYNYNMGGPMQGGGGGGGGQQYPMVQGGSNEGGQGTSNMQQQGGGGMPNMPDFPGAQALWASYMTFMASQAGNAGPMRNQSTHSNRSAGPYNTNMSHGSYSQNYGSSYNSQGNNSTGNEK